MSFTIETFQQSQDEPYYKKVERLPLVQLHGRIEMQQMKERVQQMLEEKKDVLQQLEAIQGLIPQLQEQYLTQVKNMQRVMQEQQQQSLKERIDLLRQQQGLFQQQQQAYQQTLFQQQQQLNQSQMEVQLLKLQKEVAERHIQKDRLEQRHRYPTEEETAFDEKVNDDKGENECIICFVNKRNCLIRPCKHLSLCISCACKEKLEECPECRRKITCIERVYI